MENSEEEKYSICTAVMNRNYYLSKTLPSWLVCDGVGEIVVLDWSSTEEVQNIVDDFQDGRIFLVRVDNKKRFHQAKSKNLKIRLCSNEKILSIDADIQILRRDFIKRHKLSRGSFFHGEYSVQKHTTGTCLINKSDFLKANGYNEYLFSYGFEDFDFYRRLRGIGIVGNGFTDNKKYIYHLPHSNSERINSVHTIFKVFFNDSLYRSERFNRKLSRLLKWTSRSIMGKNRVIIYHPNGQVSEQVV